MTPPSADPLPAADAAWQAGTRPRERRYVARVHRMRTVGLGLGFFCVASVFRLHGASAFAWALLVAHGFLWPHVAWRLASRSAQPAACERQNLTVDSALGGVWIALMHFSLLPSVLLATMLAVDKIGVAGVRFALRTSVVLAASCAVASALVGFRVELDSPMSVVVACVPFLVAYPLMISAVMHALGQKVAQQNRWLAQVSATDELTGLANRRQGLLAAEQALAFQKRHGGAAVLLVLDIDRFKQVNDRYGHPAGDEVLRHVAHTLRACTRVTDTPARYAGDEFLLVLPATTLEGAAEIAKRVRAELAEAMFDHAPGLQCTLSLGAAEAHAEMVDVEDWIQQADAALYRAKEAGRDRLMMAPRVDVHAGATNVAKCAAAS